MARSDMSDLEWEFIKAVLPNKAQYARKPLFRQDFVTP